MSKKMIKDLPKKSDAELKVAELDKIAGGMIVTGGAMVIGGVASKPPTGLIED